METWNQRSLPGLFEVVVVLVVVGGRAACSHRHEGQGHHGMSMSREDETRMPQSLVEKMRKELKLKAPQKQHRVTVAERLR